MQFAREPPNDRLKSSKQDCQLLALEPGRLALGHNDASEGRTPPAYFRVFQCTLEPCHFQSCQSEFGRDSGLTKLRNPWTPQGLEMEEANSNLALNGATPPNAQANNTWVFIKFPLFEVKREKFKLDLL